MNRRFSLLLVTLSLLLFPWRPVQAADMRGFGNVQETKLPAGQGAQFACDSPEHATLLIHKLAHDMAQSATVPSKWITVQIAGRAVPVLVRPGLGAYLVLAQGKQAYCFTAPLNAGQTEDGLAQAFSDAAPLVPNAQLYEAAYVYPYYLDKWSDKGMGTWYTPYDPFNDDPPGVKDVVTPHFQYLTENGLAVHLGDGSGRDETMHYIHKYHTPFHMSRWHEWDNDIARLDPFELIMPGKLFTSTAIYYGQLSDGGLNLEQYRNWDFQNFMKPYMNDPQLVDWDEPHGEIGPGPWQRTWDYGEVNRAHFAQWLQTDKHYTLASLGQAWHHDPNYFADWKQVPIPYDYSLFGAEKDSVFADRTWRIHSADLLPGVAAGLARSNYDDHRWYSMQMPGGEVNAVFEYIYKPFWYRGTITVSPAYLAAHTGPLYLMDASLTQAYGPKAPEHVWLNGVDLGGLTGAGGWQISGSKDVTGIVHAGVNHIAYKPVAAYMQGTFFLASKPMENYPFHDSALNARYVDWYDYTAAMTIKKATHTVQAMRGLDPNRPFKQMAVADRDLFDPVLADYGGFLHNTGDEAFFVPWDRRMGYPWGLRASAESSGSMVDPAAYKRWFGWFTFSGLNAFDNFIDIEAMMYTKVTPLWKENFPYLHLANRYNMKKPEIAILWSGVSNRLAPGGKASIPYVYDLGRGDIQSIGYSYAYVDEPGLHRHLADGYKVLFDDGTWVMSPQTVQDIQHYVEQGGTYIALQETGRHTLTQRDAWPIQSLSGFRVKQIRPMGGFVSILPDQPLFTKLAGQNFENEGKSIDYSGYNFADMCIALQPVAPGTQAIARYRDGEIAIGMRTLGKGRVIVLGSPFWRDSYDQIGMWWPGAGQNAFLEDLFAGLGLPPDVPANTEKVWRDRYLANNGTEEYLLLFNPSATDPQTFTTDWNTSFPITQIVDPKTGQPMTATINGSAAHLSETLQPYETKILATQSPRPPSDTVSDWFGDLAATWQGTQPGQTVTYPKGLPVYYAGFDAQGGKVVDTASVTPERLTALSSSADSGESGWNTALTNVRPQYAEIPTTSSQSVLYRWTMTSPSSWKPGDKYYLRVGNIGKAAYLNGKIVGGGDENGRDVTSLINLSGPNTLVIEANSDGYNGGASFWRQPATAAKLSLAGPWKVWVDEAHGMQTANMPVAFNGMSATKTVVIPDSWSKSHVFLRLTGNNIKFLAINDKLLFFDTPWPNYMDVTPWVKYGQPNRVFVESNGMQNWQAEQFAVTSAQLEQVSHL